ncbi:hypothetical protein G7054_g13485 [Neopestalotiopsis clavispora]|nr:hypothetical protein G7054_g13485 [Neopestalotiopsis clavispora]
MSSNPKRFLPNHDNSTSREKPPAKRYRQDDGIVGAGQPVSHPQHTALPQNGEHASTLIDTELPADNCASAPQSASDLNDGHCEVDLLCFGMLCDVQIQLGIIRPENLLNLRTHWSDNENFKVLKVILNSSHCAIQTEDATSIALLNLKTFRALTSEVEISKLFCISLIRQDDLEQGLISSTSLRPSQSHKISCCMDLIICGPQIIRDTLSRSLSRSRLFLQHPRFVPEHKVYDNPHYLGLSGSKLQEGAVLPPLLLKSTTPESEKRTSVPAGSEQVIEATEILSHIAVRCDLKETEMDGGLIKTNLLRHQKEGINFILRRESLSPDDENSLWRRHYSFETEPLYHHRISGARSPVPRDSPGGIIADDMGLGKTLTMICAIVSSLQQGATEPKESISLTIEPRSRRIPSKSTLIVLPTAYFSQGGGVLERFYWYRLVLDEAHTIRNSATKQFQAIMKLSARIRWCITGTPIQNSIEDLGSLLKFLRIPFLEDSTNFRKYIIGQTAVAGAISRRGLDNLKLILGVICIRRNASASDLTAHDTIHKEVRVDLTSAERIGYTAIGKSMKESLDAAVRSPKSKGGSQAILRGILDLRRFCNNGEQKQDLSVSPAYALDEKISILEQGSETRCALCQTSLLVNGQFDPMDLPHFTRCDTLICGNCLPKLRPSTTIVGLPEAIPCILCGTQHDSTNYLTEDTPDLSSKPPGEPQRASTSKLLALAGDVVANQMEEKSIIFTYWISTLNIIEMASRLHLVEPQWNPSVENQAIGRVVRLGQHRQVTIIRYITNDTIEESVQSRQLQKLKLALDGGLRAPDKTHDHTGRATQLKELESLLNIPS